MCDLVPLEVPGLDEGGATLVADVWLVTVVALQVELKVIGAQEGGATLCALVFLLLSLLALLTWCFLLNNNTQHVTQSEHTHTHTHAPVSYTHLTLPTSVYV